MGRAMIRDLLASALVILASSSARAFTFTASQAVSCGPFSISWTGGQAPFQLFIAPIFGTPRNASFPASALNSFQIAQFPYASGQQLLLTMSDATGFGTGGTSNVITVKPGARGQTCTTTDPGPDFQFQTNLALQQCKPFSFSAYTTAIQPITILGLIPGGPSFSLHPPVGSTSFDWTANVPAGTSIVFALVDARGRQGGAGHIQTVGASTDTSCLGSTSPSTTTTSGSGSTLTSSSSSSSTSASTSKASSSTSQNANTLPTQSLTPIKSKSNTGVIAAAAIGGLIVIAILVTVGLFFVRKRKSAAQAAQVNYGQSDYKLPGDYTPAGAPPADQYLTPAPPGSASSNLLTTASAAANPYALPSSTSSQYPGVQYQPVQEPTSPIPPSPFPAQNQFSQQNQFPQQNQFLQQNQYPSQNQYPPQNQYQQDQYSQWNPYAGGQPPQSPFTGGGVPAGPYPAMPGQYTTVQQYPAAQPPPNQYQYNVTPSYPSPNPALSPAPPFSSPYMPGQYNPATVNTAATMSDPSRASGSQFGGSQFSATQSHGGGSQFSAPQNLGGSQYSASQSYGAPGTAAQSYVGGSGPPTQGYGGVDTTSSADQKRSAGPSREKSTRLVLHTDVDDTEDVIELPPQYSAGRAPILGMPGQVTDSPAPHPDPKTQHHKRSSSSGGLAYLNE